MAKQLTGYKLIKAVPGDTRTVGTIEVTNTKNDYYELLPTYWKPQYRDEIRVGNYLAEFSNNKVYLGCQSFTRAEVIAISRIFHPEINSSLTIGGTRVTRDLLQEIISKLDY